MVEVTRGSITGGDYTALDAPAARHLACSGVPATRRIARKHIPSPPRRRRRLSHRTKITTADAAMGTHLAFAAYTSPRVDEAAVRKAFADAIAEIRRVEALMTTWHPSEITHINDAAGNAPVVVSRETFDLIGEALHASEISKGAFDITFESLHGLWKFDQDLDPHPPSAGDVKAKLSLVDYHHVKLDREKHSVYLDTRGVRIGLGGIAKGYAVDRAAAVLDSAGLSSFFVQAGGDLFTRGRKPDGKEWQAGIRDPRGARIDSFFALLAGERSRVLDGRRLRALVHRRRQALPPHHRPTHRLPRHRLAQRDDLRAHGARSPTRSTTRCSSSDPKDGLALVESLDGVGAVIVDAKNNLWVSKRLQGKLVRDRCAYRRAVRARAARSRFAHRTHLVDVGAQISA